jgi:hypothetical protein
MSIFTKNDNLYRYAKKILDGRLSSLDKDVRHCLLPRTTNTPDSPALFPALLYCFSTIDYLSSLYSGIADNRPGITARAKRYMIILMGYSDDIATKLQKLFRHNLVHLAMQQEIYISGRDHTAWSISFNNSPKHLLEENKTTPTGVLVSINNENDYVIPVNKILNIDIFLFVRDIKKSVYDSNGYLERLNKETGLQIKFENAIKDLNKGMIPLP